MMKKRMLFLLMVIGFGIYSLSAQSPSGKSLPALTLNQKVDKPWFSEQSSFHYVVEGLSTEEIKSIQDNFKKSEFSSQSKLSITGNILEIVLNPGVSQSLAEHGRLLAQLGFSLVKLNGNLVSIKRFENPNFNF